MRPERLLAKFAAFCAVGTVGTGAHYVTLIATVEAGFLEPIAATTLGFVTGAVVNYFLAASLVFDASGDHHIKLPKYIAVAAVGALLNTALLSFFIKSWELHYLLGQLAATLIVLLWNFIVNAGWTFSERGEQ